MIISKFLKSLDDFLFIKVTQKHLEIWRIVFYLLLFIYWLDPNVKDYFMLSDVYWKPVSYFKLLPFLKPPFGGIIYFQYAWQASLLFAALGFLSSVTKWISFVGALFFIGYPNNFYFVTADAAAAIFAMGFLAMCPIGKIYSVDWALKKFPTVITAETLVEAWPIRAFQMLLVTFWVCAGFQKIRISGLGWITNNSLGNYLVWAQHPVGVWVVSIPGLSYFLGAVTVFAELVAPLVFVPRFKWALLGILFVFHLSSATLLKVTFISWLFVFIFWFDNQTSNQSLTDVPRL